MSDPNNILQSISNDLQASEKKAIETGTGLSQIRSFTPVVTKKAAEAKINASENNSAEEYDNFFTGGAKFIGNTVGTILSSTLDFVGGILDVGDWHHTLDAVEKIPYVGNALSIVTGTKGLSEIYWGWGRLCR